MATRNGHHSNSAVAVSVTSPPRRYDTDTIREQARGRWIDILTTLAPELSDAASTIGSTKHHECPVHGGQNGDAFRFFPDAQETGGATCNSCGQLHDGFSVLCWIRECSFPDAVTLVAEHLGIDPKATPSTSSPKPSSNGHGQSRLAVKDPAPDQLSEIQMQRARLAKIWEQSIPDTGRIESYLRHRGLSGDVPDSLRFVQYLDFYDENRIKLGELPAIVAYVTQRNLGAVAIHRTYLDPNSPGKAQIESPKKLTTPIYQRATTGAAIRLFPLPKDTDTLAVAEGIETALAVHEATKAIVWSTVSAHGMATFEFPSQIKTIEIWSDSGEAGEKAAAELADRARSLGVSVKTMTPDAPHDWLDILNKEGPERLRLAQETTQAINGATTSQSSFQNFAVGDVVSPNDRDNWGEIVRISGETATVHFVSPNGKTKDVDFAFIALRKQGQPKGSGTRAFQPIQIEAFLSNYPKLRQEVICGLLRQGETMNLVAPTKVGKSWLTYTILIAVVTGRPLFGIFGTFPGRVLLIDNELHPETIAWRIRTVVDAMGLQSSDIAGKFDVISLRGDLVDLYGLGETFAEIEAGKYSLIIGDAWYRFLPEGVSENDNSQIMQLYNVIDSYMAQVQASWIGIHHSSKGSQSDKRVTDVGSGAGSQSRAADTHVVLREHEEDGVIVLEASLRSFKPIDPIPLRWSFPLWSPANGVDPKALRRAPTRQEEAQAERDREGKDSILEILANCGPATRKQLRTKTGIGYDRSNRLVSQLLRDNEIIEIGDSLGLPQATWQAAVQTAGQTGMHHEDI